MPNPIRQKPKTLLPNDIDEATLQNFLAAAEHLANKQTRLISADGEEVVVPEQLFDVLRRVANSLASGRGVTVIPQESQLTTQQAADLLGVSRPTLVGLLESGAIPFEKVNRHRRVTLRDLETYRQQAGAERRTTLRRMAREGQEAGLLDVSSSDMPGRA